MLVSLILLFGSALATPLPSGKASTSSNTGIGGVQQPTPQGPSGGLPGLGQNPSQGPSAHLSTQPVQKKYENILPPETNRGLPGLGQNPSQGPSESLFISAPVPNNQGPSELPPMGNEQPKHRLPTDKSLFDQDLWYATLSHQQEQLRKPPPRPNNFRSQR